MKTLLKNIFVPVLSNQAVSTLAGTLFGTGTPVFMLHRMADRKYPNRGTTVEHLRDCLNYLKKNHYTSISLETMVESIIQQIPLPEKSVVFTMDDGYLDQAEIAIPVFQAFDIPLTFFIITGLLDQVLWPWDAQTSWIIDHTKVRKLCLQLEDETLYISIDHTSNRHQARELLRNTLKEIATEKIPALIQQFAANADVQLPATAPEEYQAVDWHLARQLESKGIQFAPHAVSHNILSKMNRQECELEILGSWQTINKELKHPLNIFCYPTGRKLDYGPREIGILQQAGFVGAVATTPGYINPQQPGKTQLFHIPRFELPDNMADFIQYCSWIEYAKSALP